MMVRNPCSGDHRVVRMDEDSGPTDRRLVTLLLRLLLDREGEVVQGEVVSVRGESIGRFRRWREATRVIQTWAQREYWRT